MGRAETKSERLDEMERLLADRPWTMAEIARHLGITRQSADNYRRELERRRPIETDGNGRYWIERATYVSNIALSLEEALVLYLAARRQQRQTLLGRKPVAAALSKLARALKEPMVERLVEAANRVLDQEPAPPEREAIIATVVRAWVARQVLRLTYRGLRSAEPYPDALHPYLIEPSPWGDGTYVIGYSTRLKTEVTYKIDRIASASLGGESFDIPATFDEEKLLRQAWGIWAGDGEPVRVRLRFAPGPAARRVRESVWHHSAQRRDLPDGGCELILDIGEPRELLPWIRSWGSDVEVLAPEEVRAEVARGARRLAERYRLLGGDEVDNRLLMLWGKTAKGRDELYHPALYHLFDVAHVARQLLSGRASPRWRTILGAALGADAASLQEWLPWLVALHDLGKLSAEFQARHAMQQERLRLAGFDFGRLDPGDPFHHTLTGRLVLEAALPEPLPAGLHEIVLAMVGGHHGRYNRPDRRDVQRWHARQEPPEWQTLRRRAVEILASYLLLDPVPGVRPPNLSAAIALFNGFAILCDWLGSDEAYFAPSPHLSPRDYIPRSRERARARVRDAGFFVPVTSATPPSFAALFPSLTARPLQEAAGAIPASLLAGPSLTIAEAPAGEGKTEFAQLVARRIAALSGFDEFYVALPTMATSNAMFPRVQEHLRDRLRLDPAAVKLIHGQDFLVEHDLRLEPLENGDEGASPALTWLAPKKRALLAPFGVGTVDQAMYVALNTAHNALRLVGLAGKVVIVDEVHAYDTYMTEIIERLLRWLAECGASVILLSATLPLARRRRLMEAFTAGAIAAEVPAPGAYPSIITVSHATGEACQLAPPAATRQRATALRRLGYGDGEAGQKALWLLDQVAEGGCACWIANTVQRAQDLFAALQRLARERGDAGLDLTLLHARFPLDERQAREQRVLDLYGPKGRRPARGIVVGTQVLEQSLDVDFDVMATDLAPIDLVLQREGRLHRHRRSDRPARHGAPVLYVNAIEDEAGALRLGRDRFYNEYVMRRSWQALRERETVTLPGDYRTLVELVYDEAPPEEPALLPAYRDMLKERQRAEDEARLRLVAPPNPTQPFCYRELYRFAEDEESTAWNVAQTRLGQPSVLAIPLERVGEWAHWGAGPEARLLVSQPADRDLQRRLLRRAVRLTNPVVVQALASQGAFERTRLFQESPLLRHAQPLWLTNGSARLVAGGREVTVRLDPDLGLCYE